MQSTWETNLLTLEAAVRSQARTRAEGSIALAKVIKFYVPNRFQRKVAWVPPQKRGKLIEFCVQVKKSAWFSDLSHSLLLLSPPVDGAAANRHSQIIGRGDEFQNQILLSRT
jgi:hypothetical protein